MSAEVGHASLTLQMTDGTVVTVDGTPQEWKMDANVQRLPFDIIAFPSDFSPISQHLHGPTRTEANVTWINPVVRTVLPRRGWKGRFKRWLQAFPIS
jgi:hypothetical protein